MQSGTTGINTTRVYNPVKQAQDHDPHGHFVKRWLPRMRHVPQAWVFHPWLMPTSLRSHEGVALDIIEPLVDLATTMRESKNKLHQRRQHPSVKAVKQQVIDKHASRKRPQQFSHSSAIRPHDTQQLGFDF